MPQHAKVPTLLALTALLLAHVFTGEIADTDIWLHLMTGKHTLETRALTVPDPFSYTGNLTSAKYPGEAKTRYFNLTHEWLAQISMYLIHAATAFPGWCSRRALLLIASAHSRSHGLVANARDLSCDGRGHCGGAVAINFQQSRPFLVTFVLLAVTMAILERRRWLWALRRFFCCGRIFTAEYFMGWAMIGVYCAEALMERWRKRRCRTSGIVMVAAACVVVSAINPNGLRVNRDHAELRRQHHSIEQSRMAAHRLLGAQRV